MLKELNLQNGVTLIELMVTVAIVGIISAIAVPQYSDYIGRSESAEAASIGAGLTATLGMFYINNQFTFPNNTTDLDATPGLSKTPADYATDIIEKVDFEDGTGKFTITFKQDKANSISGGKGVIRYEPTIRAGVPTYKCIRQASTTVAARTNADCRDNTF